MAGRGSENFGDKNKESASVNGVNGIGRDALDFHDLDDVADRGIQDADRTQEELEKIREAERKRQEQERKELEALRVQIEKKENKEDEKTEPDGSDEGKNNDPQKPKDLSKFEHIAPETLKDLERNGVTLENVMDYIVQNLDIDDGPLRDLADQVVDILKSNLTKEELKNYSKEALKIARDIEELLAKIEANKVAMKDYVTEHYYA